MWSNLIIIFTILLFVLGIIYFNLSKSFSYQVYDKIKENKNRVKDYQGEKDMKLYKRSNHVVSQMPELHKDFVVSSLYSQLSVLNQLLDNFENSKITESDYAVESLRRVEFGLRKIRGFIDN
ncbi:MAG: hypothetical protein K9L84_05555 [Candidatus Omnitrophica bacterium]|nr:hypothetical protein [Candidatus Omnitrophota bacterium]MCF7894505.1 hypothetical protein [Candidatus Omnitrophota bacterium]